MKWLRKLRALRHVFNRYVVLYIFVVVLLAAYVGAESPLQGALLLCIIPVELFLQWAALRINR